MITIFTYTTQLINTNSMPLSELIRVLLLVLIGQRMALILDQTVEHKSCFFSMLRLRNKTQVVLVEQWGHNGQQ